jgi:cytochrome c oxidase cbb3-type subunit III
MKFINYLSTIAGVDIFPMISLLIFFFFFSGLVWYVWRADRKEMIMLKSIPLDLDQSRQQEDKL